MKKRIASGALALVMLLGQQIGMAEPILKQTVSAAAAAVKPAEQNEPSENQETTAASAGTTKTTASTTKTTAKTTKTTAKTSKTTKTTTTTTTAVTEPEEKTTEQTTVIADPETEETVTTTTTAEPENPRPEELRKDYNKGEFDKAHTDKVTRIKLVPKKTDIYFGQQWVAWRDERNNENVYNKRFEYDIVFVDGEENCPDSYEGDDGFKKWIDPTNDINKNDDNDKNNVKLTPCMTANNSVQSVYDAYEVPGETQTYWYMQNIYGHYYVGGYWLWGGDWYYVYVDNDAALTVNPYYKVPQTVNEGNEQKLALDNHALAYSLDGAKKATGTTKINVTNSKIFLKNLTNNAAEKGAIAAYEPSAKLVDVKLRYLVRVDETGVSPLTSETDDDGKVTLNTTVTTTKLVYQAKTVPAANCKTEGNPAQKKLNIFEDGGYIFGGDTVSEKLTVEKEEGGPTRKETKTQLVLLAKVEDETGQAIPEFNGKKFTPLEQFTLGSEEKLTADQKALNKALKSDLADTGRKEHWYVLKLVDGEYKDKFIELYIGNSKCQGKYSFGSPEGNQSSTVLYPGMKNKLVVDSSAPTVPTGNQVVSTKDPKFSLNRHFSDAREHIYRVTGNCFITENETVPDADEIEREFNFDLAVRPKDRRKCEPEDLPVKLAINSVKNQSSQQYEDHWEAEFSEEAAFHFNNINLYDKAGNLTAYGHDFCVIYDKTPPVVRVTPSIEGYQKADASEETWYKLTDASKLDLTFYAFDNNLNYVDMEMTLIGKDGNPLQEPKEYSKIAQKDSAKPKFPVWENIPSEEDEEGNEKKTNSAEKGYNLSKLMIWCRGDSFVDDLFADVSKIVVKLTAHDFDTPCEAAITICLDDTAPVLSKVKVQAEKTASQKFFRTVSFGLFSKCNLVFSFNQNGATEVKEEGSGLQSVTMQIVQGDTIFYDNLTFDDADKHWKFTVKGDKFASADQISFTVRDNVGNSAVYYVNPAKIKGILDTEKDDIERIELYATKEAANFGLRIEEAKPVITVNSEWEDDRWFKAVRDSDTNKVTLPNDDIYKFTAADSGSGLYRVSYQMLKEQKADKKGPGPAETEESEAHDLYSFETEYSKDPAAEILKTQDFEIQLSDIVNLDPDRLDEDGKYRVKITVEDLCGNTDTQEFIFSADCKSPMITGITFKPTEADERTAEEEKSFTQVIKMGDMFGFYFNAEATAIVAFRDDKASSGIQSVEYILDEAMTLENWADGKVETAEIKDIDEKDGVSGTAEFLIRKGYRGMVYVKVTDNTENTSGPVTPKEAFVIDDEETHAKNDHITYDGLETTAHRDAEGYQLFNSKQKVTVTVTDAESGIRSVSINLKVDDDETNMPVQFDNFSEEYEEGKEHEGWIIDKMDRNLVTQIHRDFFFSTDANGISIDTKMMDRARNTFASELDPFSIDMTKPVLSVTYADGALGSKQYCNTDRKLIIKVTDRNFGGSVSYNGGGQALKLVDAENYSYEGEVDITGEGEHKVTVSCEDLAGNESGERTDAFEIDKTPMKVESNIDKYAEDGKFYSGDIKLTFVFDDKNFDKNLINCTVQSPDPDDFQTQWDGKKLTVSLVDEGQFKVTVTGSDKAGNNKLMLNAEKDGRQALSSASFEIDKTDPVLVTPPEQKTMILGKENASDPDGGVKLSRVSDIVFSDKNIDSISGKVTRYFITTADGDKTVDHEVRTLETSGEINTETDGDPTATWAFEPFSWTGQKNDLLPDGIYTIELTAKDKANRTCASHHTVFVQTTAECMMYIPIEELEKFDGIGKKNDRFGALKATITAILPKDQPVEILIGGNTVPDKYLTVDDAPQPSGWAGGFVEKTIVLNLAYVQDTYQTEKMIDNYALNARTLCGGEETEYTLATISIDNAAPEGQYRSDVAERRTVYDADSFEIVIEGVSADTNIELCEFNDIVDGSARTISGKDIKFDGKTISFVLHEGDHRLSVTLRDDAGNEVSLEPISVYIGTFMNKWGGLIFGCAGGGAALIGGTALFLFLRKRKKARAAY